jgi:chromatin assembly factor 1 subunit A
LNLISNQQYFDYEVDSDEEWEEEEPGESLHGSDSEREKEAEDDYEVDNDFLVPHGHLSDEEIQQMDDEAMQDNCPEAQKAKEKILQQEFAAEMKKKTEKIKPRLIGCIWMNGDEDEDGGSMIDDIEKKYHCSDIIWRILKAREMMCSGEEIQLEDLKPEIVEPEEEATEKATAVVVEKPQKTPGQQKVRPKISGDENIKELIKLLHGNTNPRKFLVREYQAYRLKHYYNQPEYQEFSVRSVEEKLTEISEYMSCPDEGLLFGKKCWYVKPEIVREYFNDEKLPLPNQWNYVLDIEKYKNKPKQNAANQNAENGEKKSSREVSPADEEMKQSVAVYPKPEIPKIPKIAPKSIKESPKPPTITAQLQKQSPKPTSHLSTRPSTETNNSGKKRVSLLMSVPRGQSINEEKKNNLISQYLKNNNQKDDNEKKKNVEVETQNDVIEIID